MFALIPCKNSSSNAPCTLRVNPLLGERRISEVNPVNGPPHTNELQLSERLFLGRSLLF